MNTSPIEKAIRRHKGIAEKHKLVSSFTHRLPKTISPKQKRVDKYRFNSAHNAESNKLFNKKSPAQKADYHREEEALRRHPDDRG